MKITNNTIINFIVLTMLLLFGFWMHYIVYDWWINDIRWGVIGVGEIDPDGDAFGSFTAHLGVALFWTLSLFWLNDFSFTIDLKKLFSKSPKKIEIEELEKQIEGINSFLFDAQGEKFDKLLENKKKLEEKLLKLKTQK